MLQGAIYILLSMAIMLDELMIILKSRQRMNKNNLGRVESLFCFVLAVVCAVAGFLSDVHSLVVVWLDFLRTWTWYSRSKMAPLTRESGHRFLLDVEFLERESFGNGKLPTQKEVVEMMMYMCHPVRAGAANRYSMTFRSYHLNWVKVHIWYNQT